MVSGYAFEHKGCLLGGLSLLRLLDMHTLPSPKPSSPPHMHAHTHACTHKDSGTFACTHTSRHTNTQVRAPTFGLLQRDQPPQLRDALLLLAQQQLCVHACPLLPLWQKKMQEVRSP